MDALDQASALEEEQRAEALYQARKRAAHGAGREDCEDCGEVIPPARRVAAPGAIRCIACQTIFERSTR